MNDADNIPPPKLPRLALIAGATASGKSGLAVQLAKKRAAMGKRSVIINADASQVYADLHILSARPTAAEMQDIDHRLFGYRDGAYSCSAADWAKDARAQIAAAKAANALPIVVGGTGLYIRSLLDGIAPIPPIDSAIRADVRALPVAKAYADLAQQDPESAQRLNPNDATRIARALEVICSTGQPIGHWQKSLEGGIGRDIALHPLILLPCRETLYARCDARFTDMLEHGAVAEVERLLARNLPERAPVMRAIGVPEIREFLSGTMDRATMIIAGQQATRRYAKRQYTWFRNQPPESWLRIDTIENDDLRRYIETLLSE